MSYFRPVFGIGINDGKYKTHSIVNGKRKKNNSYQTWTDIIRRCRVSSFQEKCPGYLGCSVCDEWLFFSNFKEWYDSQYKEDGWQIDKDIIKKGNKIYCPEFCAMVDRRVNQFVNSVDKSRGDCLIGCFWNSSAKKYQSQCNDPFLKRVVYLGLHENEYDAHEAWRQHKHSIALKYAEMAKDVRIKNALKTMYL